jgi:hypothetical protein
MADIMRHQIHGLLGVVVGSIQLDPNPFRGPLDNCPGLALVLTSDDIYAIIGDKIVVCFCSHHSPWRVGKVSEWSRCRSRCR